jgi:hypothetical protein
MSNANITLIDEEEVRRHTCVIKNELPMLEGILTDIEDMIRLASKLINSIDREVEDVLKRYNDEQLCVRLRLAKSLALNTASSTTAIVSLLSEYVRDRYLHSKETR